MSDNNIKIGVEALDQQVSVEDGRIKGKLKAFGVGLDLEAPIPFLGAMRRFMHRTLEPLREQRAHRALQQLSEAVIVWGTAYAVEALPPDRPKFATEVGYNGASLNRLHDRLERMNLLPEASGPFEGERLHDAALLVMTSLHGDDVDRAVDADAPALHEFVTMVGTHRLDDLALARLARNAHRAISAWQNGLKATRTEDDPPWHRAAQAQRRLERLARRLPTGPDGQRSVWDRATGEFADDLDLAPNLRHDVLSAPHALARLVDTVTPPSAVFHEDIEHLAGLLEKLGLDHPSMAHQRVGRAHRIPDAYYLDYGAELLFVAAWNNWGDVIARARDEFHIGPTMPSRAGGSAVTVAVKRGAHDALAVFAETPGLLDDAPYQQWGNVFHAIARSDTTPDEALLMARWARQHTQANPDALDSGQQSPLLLAIRANLLGLAEQFLDWGADPNRVAPNGATAQDLLNALHPDDPDSPAGKVRVRVQRRLDAHTDPVVQAFNRLKMEDHQQDVIARGPTMTVADRFDRVRAHRTAQSAGTQAVPVRGFAWRPSAPPQPRIPMLRDVSARLDAAEALPAVPDEAAELSAEMAAAPRPVARSAWLRQA